MKFPSMSVKNGDPYHSDHRPVVIVTKSFPRSTRGNSGFKFEAHWIQEEGCRKVIEDAWASGDSEGGCLKDNIRGLATSLKEWSVNVLGDLEKRLKKKQRRSWRGGGGSRLVIYLLAGRRCGALRWIGWRSKLIFIGSNEPTLTGFVLVIETQLFSTMLALAEKGEIE